MNELPRTAKLVTVWLLIITAVWLLVEWAQWQRQRSRFSVDDLRQTIVLRRAPDGHFHWPGEVNGVAVDFLVDTGATSTALPLRLAREAGLAEGAPQRSATAGGLADGHASRADLRLRGGVQVDRLRVAVLPRLETPLLGMDVLGRLHFSQRGGELHIESGQAAVR